MQQMKTIFISVVTFTLGIYSLICAAQENSISSTNPLSDSDFDLDTPQDLNLGKRIYGYLAEYKRYPVYSFGLGKRSSHLYNFGLGKRSGLGEGSDGFDEYDEYSYNEEDDHIPELELYHDGDMQALDKRGQKLYSFGLGKRLHKYDFGLGKRGQILRYDFGLGKRSQPGLNRDKLYNFGLGKRNRFYSFGLGKRPYNQGPVLGRFNFGLGKRSEEFDISKNIIAKRETHEEKPSEAEDVKSKQVMDSRQTQTNKLEKISDANPGSLGTTGHADISLLSKRSPYRFGFEPGNPVFRSNSGFSRQFRKPLYSFGLGKRAPLSNNFSKINKSSEN